MTTQPRFRRMALALAPMLIGLLPLAPAAVQAADTEPAPAGTAVEQADRLAQARALIADRQWAAAIEELQRVGDRGSADWNNLMGYSHRKSQQPDHAAAERYYEQALRIAPQHRGALEYSGELYLLQGDLPRAESRLAALDRACARPCAEQATLRQAISAFKAQGRRPVQAP